MMALSFLPSMRPHVRVILDGAAPIQICRLVVQRISIFVTGFASLWSLANKRLKDQMMYVEHLPAAQAYRRPAVIFAPLGPNEDDLQHVPGITQPPTVVATGPDTPVGSNAVAGMSFDETVFCLHTRLYHIWADRA